MKRPQDLSAAVIILTILGVCCLGLYVALSGYAIHAPPSNLTRTPGSVAPAATVVIVLANTETPRATLAIAPTAPPLPSPLGAFQTITAAITSARPTVTHTPRVTIPPAAPPSQPQTAGTTSCAGFAFCPQGGPPDTRLAPTGAACPRNYIWGQVVDTSGRGLASTQISYKGPSGEAGRMETKGPPDVPGTFNIPTGQPGNTYTLWVTDAGGNRHSPEIAVKTEAYAGSGNCPTRIDFQRK